MYFKNHFLYLSFLGILFIFCSCGKGKQIPDVSHISSKVEIERFEQDLFQLDTLNISESLSKLEEKYPVFSDIYFNRILGSTDVRIAKEGHEAYVKGFINYPSIRELFDTCQLVFQDFAPLEKEFNQAFQFYQFYFPNQPIPNITTFISEYSLAAFVFGENSLAVGLDFFLGDQYPYAHYNPGNSNFSQYLTRTFNTDHLVSKTLKPLIQDMLGRPKGNRLLDFMVHNGKQLFILGQLLPYAPDSVIVEFSQAQVEWVKDNELEMWSHLLREELLYSTDWRNIRKLVEYSPHSTGMPPQAPGRTANWIGWQMVKSYMERFPETSLKDLIDMKDAQKLMDASRYKPEK